LVDVCWKLTSNEKQQMECGLIAQDLLNTISQRVLRTIIRHCVAVVKLLNTQRDAIHLSNGSTILPPGISTCFI